MVRKPEVEVFEDRSTKGQHSHPVCGQVPGDEGIFRILQRDDEVRLLGALPRRSSPCVHGSARLPPFAKHKQETSLRYTMWRFAEKNDKESIEFNSVEIVVDEESVHSLKCYRQRAPLHLPERRRKAFVYEMKWYFELNEANV